MSTKEGLRRINKLGRVLGTTGACLMLFAVVATLLASRLPNVTAGIAMGMSEFLVLGVGLLIAGIVVVTLGWIGDGFASKDEPE